MYEIYFLPLISVHRLTWILPSVLMALFAVMLAAQWPMTRRQVAEYFFDYVLDENIDAAMCFLEIPDELIDVVRPPADCSVCEGMESVDRVAGISPAIFEERYAYTGRHLYWTVCKRQNHDVTPKHLDACNSRISRC